MPKKDIITVGCLKCENKGNAISVLHTYKLLVEDKNHLARLNRVYSGCILNLKDIRKKILKEKRENLKWKKKTIEIKGEMWKVKGFKNIGPSGSEIAFKSYKWLCETCQKACKICSIGLSNSWGCPSCGKIHGKYYPEHPDYCKSCWDKKLKQLK